MASVQHREEDSRDAGDICSPHIPAAAVARCMPAFQFSHVMAPSTPRAGAAQRGPKRSIKSIAAPAAAVVQVPPVQVRYHAHNLCAEPSSHLSVHVRLLKSHCPGCLLQVSDSSWLPLRFLGACHALCERSQPAWSPYCTLSCSDHQLMMLDEHATMTVGLAGGGWGVQAGGAGGAGATGGARLRPALQRPHRPSHVQDCALPCLLCRALGDLPWRRSVRAVSPSSSHAARITTHGAPRKACTTVCATEGKPWAASWAGDPAGMQSLDSMHVRRW